MQMCEQKLSRVFPAPAGMNRLKNIAHRAINGVPRTCGDEPALRARIDEVGGCSPHLRG